MNAYVFFLATLACVAASQISSYHHGHSGHHGPLLFTDSHDDAAAGYAEYVALANAAVRSRGQGHGYRGHGYSVHQVHSDRPGNGHVYRALHGHGHGVTGVTYYGGRYGSEGQHYTPYGHEYYGHHYGNGHGVHNYLPVSGVTYYDNVGHHYSPYGNGYYGHHYGNGHGIHSHLLATYYGGHYGNALYGHGYHYDNRYGYHHH